MKSQFGEATHSLQETLQEIKNLIDTLQKYPEHTKSYLTRLEGLLKMLDYFTQPKIAAAFTDPDPVPDIRCQECNKSWTVLDACLLNFDGRWLCRNHHLPLKEGGIRPPGYYPPLVDLEKLEEERRGALKTISRDQLKLVNRNVGG